MGVTSVVGLYGVVVIVSVTGVGDVIVFRFSIFILDWMSRRLVTLTYRMTCGV